MATPEKLIENQILNYLAIRGIYVWKNQSTGIYDPRKKVFRKSNNRHHINGVADVLGILPDGRFLAIEVKAGKNKPTDDQNEFLFNINKNGGVAFWANSLNQVIEKITEVLNESRNKKTINENEKITTSNGTNSNPTG